MRSLANGSKKIARGMFFRIADDGHTDAETRGRGAFGHGFRGVVGSFGMNLRAEVFEKRRDTWLAEEDYIIDGAKRSDKERAGVFITNGAAGAFQRTDAGVRIDADDEEVAFAARGFEITDVSHVERIKTAVGKNDALAVPFMLR